MTDSKTSLKPLQPTLYELAADGHSLNFFFAQCGACGGLSFPANAPGCMHCGSPLSEAQRVTRPGGGELLEFVTLHVPLLPGMAAPSIAGDIRIAPGIVEEGVMAVGDETALRHGMTVRAIVEMKPEEGVYACRFVPVNEGAAQ